MRDTQRWPTLSVIAVSQLNHCSNSETNRSLNFFKGKNDLFNRLTMNGNCSRVCKQLKGYETTDKERSPDSRQNYQVQYFNLELLGFLAEISLALLHLS